MAAVMDSTDGIARRKGERANMPIGIILLDIISTLMDKERAKSK